ncbi:DnaB-like helicase N-terminal domain-containing protein [Prescottella subtropica]|uniref:DnaB-like helicase N-terminal domain-containing protein n=1 Tax=Prescottella subtropica TaxID=2545757 RepID=UPI0010F93C6D|nr:DnaB-like helicase N-terminal domain-containing protein [Prescottella subtropica]
MPDNNIRPIGPEPSLEHLTIGSLIWSSADDARKAAALVEADDIETPAARTILDVVLELLHAGRPHDGTAVNDELGRRGLLTDMVKRFLLDAVTCGAAANDLAPHTYTTALVAQAYRARYEQLGKALVEAADTFAECDLLPLLRQAGTDVVKHERRLAELRGEAA